MSDNYTMSNVPKTNPEFKDLYLFHGKSAYQAAVEQGFVGTEEEWILSLKDIVFGNISTFSENSDKHIYVDINSNYIYRYDKATGKYQPIGGVLGETADTAYRGDRGKIAYDHSQSEHVALDHHHIPDEIDGLMDFINSNIIGEGDAPTNLNTIKKIADSLKDDLDFAGTVDKNIVDALAAAKKYTDDVGSTTLSSAKTYSDDNLKSAKSYADQAEADALAAAKKYTDEAKNALLGSAPTDLNTLDKLAAALGDDPDFSINISNSIDQALKDAKAYADQAEADALAAAKKYTDDTVVNYLPLTGGKKITGAVSFGDVTLYPSTNKSGSLGSSTNYWYALYAVNVNASYATFSNKITASGRISVPTVAGSWISGMTTSNCSIEISTQQTNGSYHPMIGGTTYSGHFWNFGGIQDRFGFYGFKKDRTENSTDWRTEWDVTTGNIITSGTFTASKVYNAVWNDYAEWFERSNRNETIEPGDICVWCGNGVTKSTKNNTNVIGVYSDTYGHILGGEMLPNMDDNIKKYVPIGLAGRVKVKVIGTVKPGDYIIPSKIPGVGIAFSKKNYQFWKKLDMRYVIGKALESKDYKDISRITVLIINS